MREHNIEKQIKDIPLGSMRPEFKNSLKARMKQELAATAPEPVPVLRFNRLAYVNAVLLLVVIGLVTFHTFSSPAVIDTKLIAYPTGNQYAGIDSLSSVFSTGYQALMCQTVDAREEASNEGDTSQLRKEVGL